MRCLAQLFSFEDEMQVSSLFPVFFPSAGGTRVTLTGSGFPQRRGDVRCRFGEEALATSMLSPLPPTTSYAYALSPGELACNVPAPGLDAGEASSAQVFLSTIGNDFKPTGLFVNYVPEMEIETILPTRVDEQAEHSILIIGTNFPDLPGLACRFAGGVEATEGGSSELFPALWLRSTAVRCLTPTTLSPGEVVVEMTFNGVDFVAAPNILVVDEKLTVTGIAPLSGPINGGTDVVIAGTGFGVDYNTEGDSKYSWFCSFGDSLAAATVVSTVTLSCRTPAGFGISDGTEHLHEYVPVSVVRRQADGAIGDKAVAPMGAQFLYLREAMLASVNPDSGPARGGTPVTLPGFREEISYVRASGLEPDLRCRFGTSDARVVVTRHKEDDEDMLCVAPPAPEATSTNVSVEVSLNGGVDFVPSEAVFSYFETPKITTISPSTVSIAGGSIITLHGESFPSPTDDFRCVFGLDSLALHGAWVSSSVIECVAPANAPGFVFVSATFNGVDVSSSEALLEYYEDLSISSISPARTAVMSGEEITLHGTGLINSTLLSVRWRRFSDKGSSSNNAWHMSRLEFASNTAATFVAPHMSTDDGIEDDVVLELEVSSNALEFTPVNENLRFAIAGRPRIFLAFPRYGASIGATVVSIVGAGFVPAATSCRFGRRQLNETTGALIEEPSLHVRAGVQNSTHLACVTPEVTVPGEYFIEVMTGARLDNAVNNAATRDFALPDPLASAGFTFVPTPRVTGVEPATLPESGGGIVSIEGVNLTRTGLEACRFGGETVVGATWWNTSWVQCQAPPAAPGLVSVEVSLNGAEWMPAPSGGVLYEADRFIYSLQPTAGPLSGGSAVVVTGVGFAGSTGGEETAGIFFCSFGNLEVRRFNVKRLG